MNICILVVTFESLNTVALPHCRADSHPASMGIGWCRQLQLSKPRVRTGQLLVYTLYSVFTINVPLAVRFATVAKGMRKAESPKYGRFDRDLQ